MRDMIARCEEHQRVTRMAAPTMRRPATFCRIMCEAVRAPPMSGTCQFVFLKKMKEKLTGRHCAGGWTNELKESGGRSLEVSLVSLEMNSLE